MLLGGLGIVERVRLRGKNTGVLLINMKRMDLASVAELFEDEDEGGSLCAVSCATDSGRGFSECPATTLSLLADLLELSMQSVNFCRGSLKPYRLPFSSCCTGPVSPT